MAKQKDQPPSGVSFLNTSREITRDEFERQSQLIQQLINAQKVEPRRSQTYQPHNYQPQNAEQNSRPGYRPSHNRSPNGEPICYSCNKKGHLANFCSNNQPNCQLCNEIGHTARSCPNPTEPYYNSSRVSKHQSR